ncbi:LysR substrate-binding domain-containing protein [Rhodococcus sp. NPDC058514]|uniref:LysR substrate-binding domain-containing protein n=1 Tax=unclassified Rhodococcus (in: high G+C Gram-positive bacteria) TaxID=192944 RepID=UPI003668BEBE
MTEPTDPVPFRLAYVPGVTPTKWVRIWKERLPEVPLELVAVPELEAADLLRSGAAEAGLVRLPIDREGEQRLSVIAMYAETPVVVVPKDHVISAVDEVATSDLAGEIVLHPLDDMLEWEALPGEPAAERPACTADAVELVAAGIGVLVVPQSLARLHHRKDLTYRTVTDAPESRIALAWPEDATTELVEEFIGIVRGRTANSSRSGGANEAAPPPKRKASEKTAAKAAARAAAGKTPSGKSLAGKGSAGKAPAKGSAGKAAAKRGGKGSGGRGRR